MRLSYPLGFGKKKRAPSTLVLDEESGVVESALWAKTRSCVDAWTHGAMLTVTRGSKAEMLLNKRQISRRQFVSVVCGLSGLWTVEQESFESDGGPGRRCFVLLGRQNLTHHIPVQEEVDAAVEHESEPAMTGVEG